MSFIYCPWAFSHLATPLFPAIRAYESPFKRTSGKMNRRTTAVRQRAHVGAGLTAGIPRPGYIVNCTHTRVQNEYTAPIDRETWSPSERAWITMRAEIGCQRPGSTVNRCK